MTPTRRHLLLAAGVVSLASGCGGESETATAPTIRTRAVGLTPLVAMTHQCEPVLRRAAPPGRYSVLASIPGLCSRARGYVENLEADLSRFDERWICIGELRSGYCTDGAYTRGFSWDIRPGLSP